TYQTKENEILLDALERQGKDLPHGCLAGSCGACRIEILSGAENLLEPSELETNTIDAIRLNYERQNGDGSADGKTFRLSCRAKVIGDITFKTL
ncbi:MAG: (2Fe-2S)-binding protein, partial [Halobacteriovoraceae bacterium]|nr:(2Fe-2S)-binding protein [Halobacteriovoraceae bacterium]